MLLGDLIKQLDDEAAATEALLSIGDIAFIVRIQELAAAEETALGAYLRRKISHFSATADADTWMAVMMTSSRSKNPGGNCLRAILETTCMPGGGCADTSEGQA
ncbi:conserved protein of unknown function [Candidatus Filomicrobium marinum]|uniref:Uncharacterized protein n=2 Tax=Filomicrobium TaxID=119044 RepID=A0A0D6JK68_9HYPH|nr:MULTISPECIES: hypothetical protein [Filomicrobium]MCV0371279.1 hypothetical protein [Filomicrobium sp.]CFX58906.1 conserved protein of unknown function [Candidatus Filomicrobium marinum]CPR22346.1 conserved protein of unknown function [Candidatus Filomicrobium marinum]SDO87758.1 hypothetical protein SAMN04488061_1892 [Filomicrobium insigne]